MSSLTAALAESQLKKIDKLIKMRRDNAKFLMKRLKRHKEIEFMNEEKGTKHVFQLFTILMSTNKSRYKLSKFLTKKGIMTKVFFDPIHKSKFYHKKYGIKLKNTEDISSRVISLPMYPQLTKNEMMYISDSIDEFVEKENCY